LRTAPADALQALLDRPQSPFDFPDINRHRAGMSELTEHHELPWIVETKSSMQPAEKPNDHDDRNRNADKP
jgi:hypothetical protein